MSYQEDKGSDRTVALIRSSVPQDGASAAFGGIGGFSPTPPSGSAKRSPAMRRARGGGNREGDTPTSPAEFGESEGGGSPSGRGDGSPSGGSREGSPSNSFKKQSPNSGSPSSGRLTTIAPSPAPIPVEASFWDNSALEAQLQPVDVSFESAWSSGGGGEPDANPKPPSAFGLGGFQFSF